MAAATSPADVDLKFRAFSDRTRLRVLHVLLQGEMYVGDLVAILQLPQPRISRHLAYLRRAGLVNDRRSGLWKYYSLTTPTSEFHQNILSCLAKCFAEVPELQADEQRAARIKVSGGCCSQSKSDDRRGA